MRIKIKPLSVNEAWQGRRFKTDAYKAYEKELLLRLKKMELHEGDLILIATFGMSSSLSDWDNPIKPFQDILQKKYGFNDSQIVTGLIFKKKVEKGNEYIDFELLPEKSYFISVESMENIINQP